MMRIWLAAASILALSACGAGQEQAAPPPSDAVAHSQPGQDSASGGPTLDERARTILAALGEPYLRADLTNGERRFRLCASCHTLGADEPHMVGPNLHGMFASRVGAAEGFPYSDALQAADFVWTPVELDAWLANPRGYLPGNRMTFAGLRNETDRRDLIAWLAVETAAE